MGAVAEEDFINSTGVLVFLPGERSQVINKLFLS